MRRLLSQDELNALLAIEIPTDMVFNSSLEATQPSPIDRFSVDSRPTIKSKDNEHIVKSHDRKASRREGMKLASSLYRSLSLDEILLACSRALKKQVPLEHVSFVQPRRDKALVTVYSEAISDNPPFRKPHIVCLAPSRLRECLLNRKALYARAIDVTELDDIEKNYLFPNYGNSDAIAIIYWPLILKGEITGVLVLGLSHTEMVTAAQNRFLSQISYHLAIALNNSDAHYKERRRGRLLTILNEIATIAVGKNDFNQCLYEIARLLRKSFDYESVQIWMKTRTHQELVAHADKTGDEVKVSVMSPPPIVQDCWQQEHFICRCMDHQDSNISEAVDATIKSQCAAPIYYRGVYIGVLYLESMRLDAFETQDIDAIQSVASLIASRCYDLQVIKNHQRSGEYFMAVLESAEDWATLSTDSQGYVLTFSVGAQRIFHRPHNEALGNDVLTLFTDARIQRELMKMIRSGTESSRLQCFHVPHTTSEGTNYLDVNFQRVDDSEEQHIGFVGVIRDVTEKVLLEKKLRKLSIKDDLTNLLNQRGFFRVMKKEMKLCNKLHYKLSLCFIDLDNLKQFNDTHGHIYGSQVIKNTARLLRTLVRSTDSCCRYGGDEFVIIMPRTNKMVAQILIEKIRVRIGEHFQQKITASFGIAEFSGYMDSIRNLLGRADRAVYLAKSLGKNRVILSDS
jgi:diguanylate cyclase (GGDEF)-like protein/PAS domain S-box-containing protein